MRSNSRHLRTWPHKLNYSYMGHWSKESVLKYKNTKQNKTKINIIIKLRLFEGYDIFVFGKNIFTLITLRIVA